MAFLAALAANILKWLLEMGGRFVYEKVTELVEKHEQSKRRIENLKDVKDAIAEANPEKRKEATRRLLNGEKK